MSELEAAAEDLRSKGRKPYVIPVGGSNPIGATGYAACALEILSQSFDVGIRIDRIVCGSGSAGTHAGLVAGLFGLNSAIPVMGINVSRPKEPQELVHSLVERTAAHLGIRERVPKRRGALLRRLRQAGLFPPDSGDGGSGRKLANRGILLDPIPERRWRV
jgi:D-cysteine desulfhydrase